MADLALVFGWSPETMDRMDPAELMQWRARAAARHNPED
ncbi:MULTISPECIES: GpE family phage tail protein [unclassified Sphingomonas]|nr:MULTISPECIES: GpE family phage tail protein [unclassified Sphingomonas]